MSDVSKGVDPKEGHPTQVQRRKPEPEADRHPDDSRSPQDVLDEVLAGALALSTRDRVELINNKIRDPDLRARLLERSYEIYGNLPPEHPDRRRTAASLAAIRSSQLSSTISEASDPADPLPESPA